MTHKVFISYSGDRDERRALWEALREHGLRPWRDVEDLDIAANTLRDVQAEIAGCDTAILWLSDEAFMSAFVSNVEMPAIRAAFRDRGIGILPVFDGVGPEEADALSIQRWGFSVSSFNGHVLDRSNTATVESSAVAERLVRAGLGSSDASPHRPLVRGVTRDDVAGCQRDADLSFDWRHAYADGRVPDQDETARLAEALHSSMTHLKTAFAAGFVDLELKIHLHLGIAMGHALRRTTGFIPHMRRDGKPWIAEVLDPSLRRGLDVGMEPGPASTSAASVEVSITRDVTDGVDHLIRTTGRRYRQRIALLPNDGPGQSSLVDPMTANVWARQVADEMAKLSSLTGITGIDLFVASPLEFSVLLGWWLNAPGLVDIYHWTGNRGPYTKAWTLPLV